MKIIYILSGMFLALVSQLYCSEGREEYAEVTFTVDEIIEGRCATRLMSVIGCYYEEMDQAVRLIVVSSKDLDEMVPLEDGFMYAFTFSNHSAYINDLVGKEYTVLMDVDDLSSLCVERESEEVLKRDVPFHKYVRNLKYTSRYIYTLGEKEEFAEDDEYIYYNNTAGSVELCFVVTEIVDGYYVHQAKYVDGEVQLVKVPTRLVFVTCSMLYNICPTSVEFAFTFTDPVEDLESIVGKRFTTTIDVDDVKSLVVDKYSGPTLIWHIPFEPIYYESEAK